MHSSSTRAVRLLLRGLLLRGLFLRGLLLGGILLSALFLSTLFPACSRAGTEKSRNNDNAGGPPAGALPSVRTCSPEAVKYAAGISVPGTVVSLEKHAVSSLVEGLVTEVLAERGQLVDKNQVIIRVSTGQLELQHKIIEEQLTRARTDLQQAQINRAEMQRQAERHLLKVERLQRQLQHARKLCAHTTQEYQQAETLQKAGGISSAALQKSRLDVEQQEASLANLESQLNEALIGLRDEDLTAELAELSDLSSDPVDRSAAYLQSVAKQADIHIKAAESRIAELTDKLHHNEDKQRACSIQSPGSGYLSEVHTLPGSYLHAGDPLATLVEIDSLQVQAQIAASHRPDIRRGQSAQIKLSRYDHPVSGQVRQLGPVIHPNSSSFEVLCSLNSPPVDIIPGMEAHLTIRTEEPRRVYTLPRQALIEPGEGAVFTVRQQRAFTQAVQILKAGPEKVYVEGGLSGKEEIILSPPTLLREGMQIEVLSKPQPKEDRYGLLY
ncbi:MAG: efflux RND transporter periplasmic adaptor subunit [Spirochaetaceae bacterium]|nr:efflux RND transporter periplasmic adaptor subunit [Spirochaetaceae bacterium]MCF7950751.1 efflux RND transporter periplasmic adaptor subunit [Spirochaetaceae bacterium]